MSGWIVVRKLYVNILYELLVFIDGCNWKWNFAPSGRGGEGSMPEDLALVFHPTECREKEEIFDVPWYRTELKNKNRMQSSPEIQGA